LHYDLKKILFYYGKACQLGDFDACTNVEETKALNSDDISSAGENK
jgi:TPR repeat protein